MLDVPDVAPDTAFHVLQLLGLAAVAGNLAPAGDAGFHEVTDHVFVDQFGVFFRMLQHVRTGTDDAHVAQQYVDELRHFVQVCLAHDVAPFGLARVVLGGLQGIRFGIHLHAAELDDVEFLVVQSVTLLPEEEGAGHGQLGQDGDHQQDEGKEGAEEEKGEYDVEGTFHHLVGRFAQRVTAQTEVGDIAQHVQVHPVLQVVMQVGHTVEVYQVVLAVVDDGDDVVPVDRRKSAEQVMHLWVLLQVSRNLVGSTQVRTFLGETVARGKIEVAVYPVAGKGVVHHLVIQFQVAGRSADQHDVAQVAAFAPVHLDQGTEGKAVGTDHQEAEADVGEVEVAVYTYILQDGKGQGGNDGEVCRVAENLHHNLVGINLAQVQNHAVLAGSHQVAETDDELEGPDGHPRGDG